MCSVCLDCLWHIWCEWWRCPRDPDPRVRVKLKIRQSEMYCYHAKMSLPFMWSSGVSNLDLSSLFILTAVHRRPRFMVLEILCLLQVYSGVSKKGFTQPRTLARQDIVLTTYETLRKELDYVDLPHSNSKCSIRDTTTCTCLHVWCTMLLSVLLFRNCLVQNLLRFYFPINIYNKM